MNVFLTLDYELYFGQPTGSVQKCMIDPTNRLIEIGEKHEIGMTYFVDVGFLIALEREIPKFPKLQNDFDLVIQQLNRLMKTGNDVQLHIHPHWEDCTYTGKKWNMVTNLHYKLSDYSKEEAAELITRYRRKLEIYIGKSINSFRAGGWCLQPFSHVREAFWENGIRFDSTVFQGGKFESEHYYFDFTDAPDKGRYLFEEKLTEVDAKGRFTEVPIGGYKYNPLFYWQLYGWGRIRPSRHKFIGDGNYIPQPGRKKKHLTTSSWNHVSMDGFFSKMMSPIAKKMSRKGRTDLVIIGHPKSQTKFSLEQTEKFIRKNKKKYQFLTFRDL